MIVSSIGATAYGNKTTQSTPNFTASMKYLSNIHDKAFVDTLAKDLKLGEDTAKSLKNTIWDFLHSNKLKSLTDIGGEEMIEEQSRLADKITNNIKIPEDKREFIVTELIKRCDEGDNYIPGGLKEFEEMHALEESFANIFKLGKKSPVCGSLFSVQADKEMYNHLAKVLRLSPEEGLEFKQTIKEFLKDNNLSSIEDLGGFDGILKQSELAELLTNKFELGDAESIAVIAELTTRANSFKGLDYIPMANIFVKDAEPLEKLIKDGGYNYEVKPSGIKFGTHVLPGIKFSDELFQVMSEEAKVKGLKNIFEIFMPENNPINSATYKYINSSKLSENEKTNLFIDLYDIAKNPEEYINKVPTKPLSDIFYSGISCDLMADKIAEKFKLDSCYKEGVREYLAKLCPSHVPGGENASPTKIAYELSEKYNLPIGAEKELTKIIKDVQGTKKSSLDKYAIDRMFSDFDMPF